MIKATHELVAKAKKLRASGHSYGAIGLRLGLNYQTVRCWLDPEYHERRMEQITRSQARRRAHLEAAEAAE